jgi:hypothetical protein
MGGGAQTEGMIEIAFINAQPLVRRALIGARADDPVIPEPQRRRARTGARRRGTS